MGKLGDCAFVHSRKLLGELPAISIGGTVYQVMELFCKLGNICRCCRMATSSSNNCNLNLPSYHCSQHSVNMNRTHTQNTTDKSVGNHMTPPTHMVMMARSGGARLAPMKSARFSCLVLFRTETSSLNLATCCGEALRTEKCLMATTPCQLPRYILLMCPSPRQSNSLMFLKGMLHSSTTLFLCC